LDESLVSGEYKAKLVWIWFSLWVGILQQSP